jgi:hypothetical protein
VEAGALFTLFFVYQRQLWRSPLRDFAVVVWLFLFVAVASMMRAPTLYVSQAQGIYLYAAPFMLFAWAVMIRPTDVLARRLITVFSIYLILNIGVVMLLQLPIIRGKSDFIHGLYSDAHVLGAFLAVGSCVAFSRFMAAGGASSLFVATALFLVSYFPANEKMIIFNVVWCLAALCWRLAHHPRSLRALAVSAVCGVAVLVGATDRQTVNRWLRVDVLTGQQVTELGPVRSWTLAGNALDSAPELLVGVGPSNYGGVAAASAVLNQPRQSAVLSVTARALVRDEPELAAGATSWMTNTWANLLAEFGVIGMALFTVALARIAVPIYLWNPRRDPERFVRLLSIVALASIVWQGFIAPYTNWNEPILIYPTMVLAAYCHYRIHAAARVAAAADTAAAT